tara:strand:- start:3592 stop:3738 length:147 start_codon:yes stop_codon:yes gene_type:complete
MRSYPRNPKKFEKGLPICPICKIAMAKIKKEKELKFQCPACKVKTDGS